MKKPKTGIVVFPGSNCERDLGFALEKVLDISPVYHWHDETLPNDLDWIFLPGGFSFGDYLRAGAIAKTSRAAQGLGDWLNQSGKLLVGICNGFQILTELGLLPGTLRKNESGKFISATIPLRPEASNLLGLSESRTYAFPLAHGEGRYYADSETLASLEENTQILFRYAHADGQVDEGANINGSSNGIAGICDEHRKVIGLMPHPERACDPCLGNEDGNDFFDALMRGYA